MQGARQVPPGTNGRYVVFTAPPRRGRSPHRPRDADIGVELRQGRLPFLEEGQELRIFGLGAEIEGGRTDRSAGVSRDVRTIVLLRGKLRERRDVRRQGRIDTRFRQLQSSSV